MAHPNGGDLYFSSLRFRSDPLINLAASRSSPSSADQWSAVSPKSPRSSGLAPASNSLIPASSAPRLAAPISGESLFLPSSGPLEVQIRAGRLLRLLRGLGFLGGLAPHP